MDNIVLRSARKSNSIRLLHLVLPLCCACFIVTCIPSSPRWMFVSAENRALIALNSRESGDALPIAVDDTTTIGLEASIFTVVGDSKRILHVTCMYTLNLERTKRHISVRGDRASLSLRGNRLQLDKFFSSESGRRLTGKADGIMFHYTMPPELSFLPNLADSAVHVTIDAVLDSVIWVDNSPLQVPKVTMSVMLPRIKEQ